jgi:hypothetical protein
MFCVVQKKAMHDLEVTAVGIKQKARHRRLLLMRKTRRRNEQRRHAE